MELLNGQLIAKELLGTAQARLEALKLEHILPGFGIVLVGQDPASVLYTKKKKQIAEQFGLRAEFIHLLETTSLEEIKETMELLQSNLGCLIIQLPLPEDLTGHTQELLDLIKIENDLDCLASASQQLLAQDQAIVLPPTVDAVLEVFKRLEIDMSNKKVCLFGYGRLVGKPLSLVLANKVADLIIVGQDTPNKSELVKSADIVIAGVGQPHLLSWKDFKPEAIVIDCGSALLGHKIVGDVNPLNMAKVSSFFAGVPGGVGPITISKLIINCLKLNEYKLGKKSIDTPGDIY